jgi:hypothetical protein
LKPKAKSKDSKTVNNALEQLVRSNEQGQEEANESVRHEESLRRFEELANEDNVFTDEIDLTSNEWLEVEPVELQKRYDIIRRYVSFNFEK